MGDSDTPDIADIYGDFGVVATPLAAWRLFSFPVSDVEVVSDVDAIISVSAGAYADIGSIQNPSLATINLCTKFEVPMFIRCEWVTEGH